MSEPKQYVDVAWTRAVVDGIFDKLEPMIERGLDKGGNTEAADDFANIVVPHMQQNIYQNLAVELTPVVNNAIAHYLSAVAQMKGDRTIVSEHDDKGRIRQFIRLPIWAPIPDGIDAAWKKTAEAAKAIEAKAASTK